MVSVSNQQSGITYSQRDSRELMTEEKQVFVTALTGIQNDLASTTAAFYQQEISIRKQVFSDMREQNRWIA
jgi:hypothetical protein